VIRARTTARCAADLATLSLEVTATLADKLEQRLQAPESGELIDGLRQRSCYSLHAGRYRAATWYDIEHDVLWLLAAGIHISGDRNDFYNVAVQWERSGRLYPTSDDYQDLDNDERRDRSVRETMELRSLRDRVVSDPTLGHQMYESDDGLHAEIWAEIIEELALIVVRIRMFRWHDRWIRDPELALLLQGVLGSYHESVEDEWPYRSFEAYVARQP